MRWLRGLRHASDSLAARAVVLTVVSAAAVAAQAPAEHQAFHRDIGSVPMSDGVKLAYVVYRPSPQGRFPAVLQYDAYDSGGMAPGGWVIDFPKRGYAVVGASVRGETAPRTLDGPA